MLYKLAHFTMTTQTTLIKTDLPLIITGPTASGKTSLAIAIAQGLQGELINADSQQQFKNFTVATNFNSQEFTNVPYHLFAHYYVGQQPSITDYLEQAESVISQVKQRSHLPVIVGGTGMYIWGLINGLQLQQVDSTLIEQLRLELAAMTIEELQAQLPSPELQKLNNSDLLNPRRLTNRVINLRFNQAPRHNFGGKYTYQVIVIMPSINELEPKLHQRIETMWQNGIVEEFRPFFNQHQTVPVLGCKEIFSFLAEEITAEQCKQKLYVANRKYAIRQLRYLQKYVVRANLPTTVQVISLAQADQLRKRYESAS